MAYLRFDYLESPGKNFAYELFKLIGKLVPLNSQIRDEFYQFLQKISKNLTCTSSPCHQSTSMSLNTKRMTSSLDAALMTHSQRILSGK